MHATVFELGARRRCERLRGLRHQHFVRARLFLDPCRFVNGNASDVITDELDLACMHARAVSAARESARLG